MSDIELPDYDGHKLNLHEVDPLPIDDSLEQGTAYTSIDDATASTPKNKVSAYAPPGLTNHSVTWYLTRLQRYSTYAFSAFTVMHITNTSLIPLLTRSVPASEPYLLLTRPYYQSPIAEPLIIALPLWTHVISGVALRIHRRNQTASRYGETATTSSTSTSTHRSTLTFLDPKFWPATNLTTKTGYVLVPLLTGHILLTRALPLAHGKGNVGLEFIAHTFAQPHAVFSYLGFAALVGVASWHVVWGWAKWLGWTPEQVVEMGPRREVWKRRRWMGIHAVAGLVTAVWLAGSFGVVAQGGRAVGWVGREYDDLLRAIPVVGKWL